MSLDINQLDTICALASAKAQCAISIIRVCGANTKNILEKIFSKKVKSLKATHGQITNNKGQIIDDVIVIYYPKNKSFVGLDSLEINCHGNPIIIDEIIERLKECGARLAEPGEFSMRAVLNGKIDLVQAESIANLIHAQSSLAKNIALRGLEGYLSRKITPIRHSIITILANIEARMDFVDEDLGSYDKSILINNLETNILDIKTILKNADVGLKLYEGARIVICGEPNAGKSTLLNCLVKDERAIVHESAGTTRDVIEVNFMLGDIQATLIDIAGIREFNKASEIEQIGINKAFFELNRADIIIWLADATQAQPFENEEIKEQITKSSAQVIKVLNKVEIAKNCDTNYIAISAKNNINIDLLINNLSNLLIANTISGEEVFITKKRQKVELEQALNSLSLAFDALKLGLVDEIVCFELRAAGTCFDRLLGTKISEDILDKIFSEFCIGK